MKHKLAALRLGVVLLFILGVFSPVVSTGAGAQDLTCDDFNSERAAQAVLDADPDMEETLDPDGDGIACNHEEDAGDDASADDEEDAATDDEEDASDDDGTGGSGDLDDYLADVTGQAADWADALAEIDDLGFFDGSAAEDDVETIVGLFEELAEAPDVAAEFEAPDGGEDVQAAFEDLADGYGDLGNAFLDWLETESGSDEEAEAEEALLDATDALPDLQDEFDAAVEDAGGSSDGGDATDDGRDDDEDATDDDGGSGGDADAYLEDVSDQVATWADMLATLEDLDPISGGLSEDEVDDVIAIVEEFTAAPDVAAEFEAPDGLEDVQDAFEALADGYAEVATTFTDWLDTDAGSDEEADAEDAYNEALDAVIDLQDDFDAAVEDAGGSSDGSDGRDDEEDATDDSADDSTDDAADDGSTDDEDATDDDGGSGGDADAYLEDVRTHADELVAGADRLIEILSADEVTDADREDLAAILELWADAPDVAADMDVPDGMEEVQEAYEETADAYATVVDNFDAWLATDAETTESEEAFQEFIDSLTEAMELSDTLDGLLADEGA